MHASDATFDLPAMADVVRRLAVALVCGFVTIYSDVARVMFTSTKTYKAFLYPAFFFYLVFGAAWIYTAAYLQRKNIRWFILHEGFLYGATATAFLASVLWIVGMWPEYGVLTIPLYLVMVTLVTHLVGLAHCTHANRQ